MAEEAAGGLDLEAIQQYVRELLGWVDCIAEMAAAWIFLAAAGVLLIGQANESLPKKHSLGSASEPPAHGVGKFAYTVEMRGFLSVGCLTGVGGPCS